MTVFSTQDFSDWNGGTGFYRPSAVQNAIQLGENKAVEWLNTGLVPTSFEDDLPWPSDWSPGRGFSSHGKIMLQRVRLISIESIESVWSTCDNCGQEVGSECANIVNARHSIIRVGDPWRYWCGTGRCPERLRVTYTAGFSVAEAAAGTPIGTQLRAIVFNAALGFLITSIGLNADGNVFKPSYTSAGYSESRQGPERSGAEEEVNEFIQMAFSLARNLRVKRLPRYQ